MRYHFAPVKLAIIKKSKNNKCWRGCGERWTPVHCWLEYKLLPPIWKSVCIFLKKLKIKLPYKPAIPLMGMHLRKEMKMLIQNLYLNVHSRIIYTSQNVKATRVSINGWIDKEDEVYMHNEILLGHRKEWKYAIFNNVDGPREYCA